MSAPPSRRAPRAWSCSLVLAAGLMVPGCEGTLSALAPEGAATFGSGPRPECPQDPDCAIGGDCRAHRCPDHWECETDGAGGERCVNPGPDYPDDAAGWSCRDEAGTTICSRRGGDAPDAAGGAGWSCELAMSEEVVCRAGSPSYPDRGGGSEWRCSFAEGLRLCERGPTGGGGSGDGSGSGGGWTCAPSAAGGTECTQASPSTPDGADGWNCYDALGASFCSRRGDDLPDAGAGWTCAPSGMLVLCRDATPDYPDGGGDGVWDCRYAEGERLCTSDAPRPGAPSGGPGSGEPGSVPAEPPGSGSPGAGVPGPGAPAVPHDCTRGDPACDVAVCAPDARAEARFLDDQDGADDGEIVVFSDRSPAVSCATVRVGRTGWYRVHDLALAESCEQQRDESAFLTVTNSCSSEGYPLEHNSGARFVWQDADNRRCTSDAECGAGFACRAPRHGAHTCCTPADPIFMGTFLLRAGEDNRLCLHHWCPVWSAEGERGGFVNAACADPLNSVHFRLDAHAVTCAEELAVPAACR